MASFDAFLPMLLRHEGGYVNDPQDPGGHTNKGITLKLFRDVARSLIGVVPTLENLRALTDAQAGVIYRARFWDKLRADEWPSQNLANLVADMYVNAGAHAIRLLQRCLNDMGGTLIVADGKFGPKTLARVLAVDQSELYTSYRAARIEYYHRLAASNSRYAKFLRGWLNRVESFPETLHVEQKQHHHGRGSEVNNV